MTGNEHAFDSLETLTVPTKRCNFFGIRQRWTAGAVAMVLSAALLVACSPVVGEKNSIPAYATATPNPVQYVTPVSESPRIVPTASGTPYILSEFVFADGSPASPNQALIKEKINQPERISAPGYVSTGDGIFRDEEEFVQVDGADRLISLQTCIKRDRFISCQTDVVYAPPAVFDRYQVGQTVVKSDFQYLAREDQLHSKRIIKHRRVLRRYARNKQPTFIDTEQMPDRRSVNIARP